MSESGVVFVIDDDQSVRKALSRLVRLAGHQTVSFPSAEDFLSIDLPDKPCCAILDIRLPGQSGLDLQERLSETDREMPIIFVTGHGDVSKSVQAMKAGAVDFLEKPFDAEQLLRAVEWALEKDREIRRERLEKTAIRHRLASLTPREREVFERVVTGLLNKQIAAQLGAAEKTIKVHRARVMRKMEADSLADLVRMSIAVGIRGPESA